METISAKEHELRHIFSDDYSFSIPAYQRPYAWTEDQVRELLDDLSTCLSEDDGKSAITSLSPYFLGSIVLIKGMKEAKADVVDGQQRLTTLTILLAVLRDLSSGKSSSALQRFICEEGDIYKGTEDRFRLLLRSLDAPFFQRHIQTAAGTNGLEDDEEFVGLSDSQRNIRDNALFLRRRLSGMTLGERDRLTMFVIQRCFLVVVAASDQESAYRVFSVLNSRGLDLSPTDVLKAQIIGAIPERDRQKHNDIWEAHELELGRESFTELFSHIRMIFQRAKARKSLTSEFHESVNPLKAPAGFVTETLVPMSTAFQAVTNAAYESASNADEINAHLTHLGRLDNVDWVPPAMAFLSRHGKQPKAVLPFIKDLERLAYYLFVTRAHVTDRIGRYADLLGAMNASTPLTGPKSPLQLSKAEKKSFLAALDGSIYTMTRVRLPLLLRLDDLLSAGGVAHDLDVITVEHVLPQNPNPSSQWMTLFPDEDERGQWTHRLGNLALLPRRKNSQAQNYDFDDKKNIYFTYKGTVTFALTTQIIQMKAWTLKTLAKRQESLIGTLVDAWQLDA